MKVNQPLPDIDSASEFEDYPQTTTCCITNVLYSYKEVVNVRILKYKWKSAENVCKVARQIKVKVKVLIKRIQIASQIKDNV